MDEVKKKGSAFKSLPASLKPLEPSAELLDAALAKMAVPLRH